MTKYIKMSLVAFTGLFFFGCAGSALDTKSSTSKARIIYEVPSSAGAENVKTALYDALSLRLSNIQESENFMPEQLPDNPDSPMNSNAFGGLASLAAGSPQFEIMRLDTSNAYYSVQGVYQGVSGPFNDSALALKGAVYPYSKGYKVYLYGFYQEKTDGLAGMIGKGMVEGITGEKSNLLLVAQVRDKFKELVPSATITSQQPSALQQVELTKFNKGY